MTSLDYLQSLPIGVFDSGIGGLTVLKALKEVLPFEKFHYLADSFNHPFGEKKPSELQAIVQANLSYFQNAPIKLLIIACHTASTLSHPEIYANNAFPVLQILPFTMRMIAENKEFKSFAVLATKQTAESKLYEHALHKLKTEIHCQSFPCQEIERLIENGEQDINTIETVIKTTLSNIPSELFECVVLGCTHFPIYKNHLISYFQKATILDPSLNFATEVSHFLSQHHLLNPSKKPFSDTFCVTKNLEAFKKNLHLYFDDFSPLASPDFIELVLPQKIPQYL